jgi:HPt (histidine-containing phosphotransfer) domain-containing protein
VGNNLPILDQTALNRLKADVGPDSAAFLIESLKSEIKAGEQAFPEHVAAGDLSALEIQAHALKSAARSFGAMRLGEICLLLEQGAKARTTDGLSSALKDFEKACSEALAAFDTA